MTTEDFDKGVLERTSKWLNGCRGLWLLLVCWCTSSPALAADVYIVDTIKRDHSLALAETLNQSCVSCRPVKYMDMKGSVRIGRQISYELAKLKAEDALDLVITLGKPATRMIARELTGVPIFYSLGTPDADPDRHGNDVINLVVPPSPKLKLQALKALAPNIKNVGFLATKDSLDEIRDPTVAAAREMGIQIKFYYVQRPYDVPVGLRTAIQEMDAIIFIQDRVAINADTVEYILQLTLENQVPTLVDSDKLVDRGMLAALTVDPVRLGEKLGGAIEQYLSTGALPDLSDDPTLYQLLVNRDTLRQTPDVTGDAPAGLKMVMR